MPPRPAKQRRLAGAANVEPGFASANTGLADQLAARQRSDAALAALHATFTTQLLPHLAAAEWSELNLGLVLNLLAQRASYLPEYGDVQDAAREAQAMVISWADDDARASRQLWIQHEVEALLESQAAAGCEPMDAASTVAPPTPMLEPGFIAWMQRHGEQLAERLSFASSCAAVLDLKATLRAAVSAWSPDLAASFTLHVARELTVLTAWSSNAPLYTSVESMASFLSEWQRNPDKRRIYSLHSLQTVTEVAEAADGIDSAAAALASKQKAAAAAAAAMPPPKRAPARKWRATRSAPVPAPASTAGPSSAVCAPLRELHAEEPEAFTAVDVGLLELYRKSPSLDGHQAQAERAPLSDADEWLCYAATPSLEDLGLMLLQ
jgi:hypothetical protein